VRKTAWVVAAILVLVLGAGVYVVVRSHEPIRISRADVVSVRLQPIPEGPVLEFGSSGDRHPVDAIRDRIPVPLPHPVWQGFSCSGGGDLIVTLANGRQISYGPCRRPAAINALWAQMVSIASDGACEPRCGP
jgi:hypothetical protein